MPERSGLDPSGPHTARRRDAGRIVRLARQTEQYSFAGSRRPANATVMQGSASLKPATGRFHNAPHKYTVHVYFEDTGIGRGAWVGRVGAVRVGLGGSEYI